MPAKQSLKYSFSKAFEDPESGAVAFEEESVKKVYTSQNSYEFERVTVRLEHSSIVITVEICPEKCSIIRHVCISFVNHVWSTSRTL